LLATFFKCPTSSTTAFSEPTCVLEGDGDFIGVGSRAKRPELETDHSPPRNCLIKEECLYTPLRNSLLRHRGRFCPYWNTFSIFPVLLFMEREIW